MTTRVREREKKNEWLLSCWNIQTNLDKKKENETTSLTRKEKVREMVSIVVKNKNK